MSDVSPVSYSSVSGTSECPPPESVPCRLSRLPFSTSSTPGSSLYTRSLGLRRGTGGRKGRQTGGRERVGRCEGGGQKGDIMRKRARGGAESLVFRVVERFPLKHDEGGVTPGPTGGIEDFSGGCGGCWWCMWKVVSEWVAKVFDPVSPRVCWWTDDSSSVKEVTSVVFHGRRSR